MTTHTNETTHRNKKGSRTNPMKRSYLAIAGTALLASGVTAFAIAEPDYSRIKKDINVMVGIVKSSFDHNEDCDRCRVSISGHYLADQGVVFDVTPASSHATLAFGDEHAVFSGDIMPPPIPELVGDIIADVRMSFGGDDWEGDWEDWGFSDNQALAELAREARDNMRESRHELRELSRAMRELELRAIHADEDERRTLDAQRDEIESQIAEVERKHKELEQTMEGHLEQKREAREARVAKAKEKRAERFRAMEDVVLNTFCDYSSSMRSIPRGEKISIIVHQDREASNIYVFEQDKLQDCDSRKSNVREHALSYAF